VDNHRQKGFEQAALEHLDALYGYAMSLVRNPVDADDLVQETYLRGVQAAREKTPEGHFKAWLFTILRNIWINQWRRQHHGPEFVQIGSVQELPEHADQWAADEMHRPDALMERQLLRDEIVRAIESLPDVYREAIVLRYIEGFSYNEIAEILQCPAGTVMSRISRARAELRRRLSDLTSRQAKEAQK